MNQPNSSDSPTSLDSNGPTMLAMRILSGEIGMNPVVELAESFIQDIHPMVDDIEQQLRIPNLAQAERLSHSLKASASIFELTSVMEPAAQIENHSHDGFLDEALVAHEQLRGTAISAIELLQTSISALKGIYSND